VGVVVDSAAEEEVAVEGMDVEISVASVNQFVPLLMEYSIVTLVFLLDAPVVALDSPSLK
tara:strand:+ start:582 stop:761 length:180 start_codon:yes stop_codon:yes gene_type:complete